MKNFQSELLSVLTANAGNRLTPELSSGLLAKINQLFEVEMQKRMAEHAAVKTFKEADAPIAGGE